MGDNMDIGSKVTPKTTAGLILADCPTNGEYKQQRKNVCVFRDVGTIIDRSDCVIDYDMWDELAGEQIYNIGKIPYVNYLVQCDTGIGWAGAGALLTIDKEN